MKKIALILVAVLLASSLIACNNTTEEEGDSFGVSSYSDTARQQDIVVDGVTVGTITYVDNVGKTATITKYTGIYAPHKVVIPETVGEGDSLRTVTGIDSEAFYYCTSITSISLPATLEKIGTMAFAGCDNLEAISVPASVTEIGKYAFACCAKLSKVEFVAGSELKTIGDFAFNECTALETFAIPEGTEAIGRCAFRKCEKLAAIKTPASLRSLGDMVFFGCTALNNPGAVDVSASVNIEKIFEYDEEKDENVPVPNLGDYIFSGINKAFITVPADANSDLAQHVAKMADLEVEEDAE